MQMKSLAFILVAAVGAWSCSSSDAGPSGNAGTQSGSGGSAGSTGGSGGTSSGSGGTESGSGGTASGSSGSGGSGGSSGSGGSAGSDTAGSAGTAGDATGGSAGAGTGGRAGAGTGGSGGSAAGGSGGGATDGGGTPEAGGTALSYAKDIAPILAANCATCHTTMNPPKGGLKMSYDALVTNGAVAGASTKTCTMLDSTKMRVVPGKPEASLLFIKISHTTTELKAAMCDDAMPENKPALSTALQTKIKDWITQGAKP